MSNAEKMNPAVELKLGDKTLKIVFDLWAFCLIEEQTGKNAINGEAFQNPSANDLVTLIWAGVQKHHQELQRKEIAHYMDLQNVQELPAGPADGILVTAAVKMRTVLLGQCDPL